jgi:predicted O-methyltransferase YrrM
MSRRTIGLTDEVYQYLVRASVREPEVLTRLREETSRDPMARMQIAPEQGQFMALLVELMGVVDALEIGVFTGYSALWVALALPENGCLVACDVDETWTATAKRFWAEAGVEERIDLRIAPALDTLPGLIREGRGGTFDFAFIDADKAEYVAYFEHCLTLLRPGGLIAVDNTLWNGDVANPADRSQDTVAIRAFNERLHADQRVSLSLVPIGDGLTLARKR